eukprot:4210603-Alexandrium_andersonii.AAC.1
MPRAPAQVPPNPPARRVPSRGRAGAAATSAARAGGVPTAEDGPPRRPGTPHRTPGVTARGRA